MKIMVMTHLPKEATPLNQTLEEFQDFIKKDYASPGTEIVCCFPEELVGGGAIHSKQRESKALSGFTRSLLAPAIIKKALEAQENGFDAVVLFNTYDPGVQDARLVLRIPFVGVGRASCHLALTLADRIGIIVPFDTHIPNTQRILKSYGLSGFISTFVAANPPFGKEKNNEEVFQCFENAGLKCLQSGAQIIVPLCGAFIPLTLSARVLSDRVGIQFVDPLAVGIGLSEILVRFGLTHSEKAYPFLKILSSEIA